jgi:hypothetical protein
MGDFVGVAVGVIVAVCVGVFMVFDVVVEPEEASCVDTLPGATCAHTVLGQINWIQPSNASSARALTAPEASLFIFFPRICKYEEAALTAPRVA